MQASGRKGAFMKGRVLTVRNRRKNAVFVTNAKWAMTKKNLRIIVEIKRLDSSKRKKLRI